MSINNATTQTAPTHILNGLAQANSIDIGAGDQLLVGLKGTLEVATNIVVEATGGDALILTNGGAAYLGYGGAPGNLYIGGAVFGASGGGELVIGGTSPSNPAPSGILENAVVWLDSTGSQIVFDISDKSPYVFSSTVFGAGGIVQEAAGTTIVITGNDFAAGPTMISAGTIQIGNGGSSGTFASVSVTIAATGALVFDQNIPGTLIGVGNTFHGSGNLTFEGGGVFELAADESGFSGSTTIASGTTLQVEAGGSVGALGTGPIIDNGKLYLLRSGAMTVDDAISGTGSVTQSLGSTTLTHANTYSGGTEIGGGTLKTGAVNALGSGDDTVDAGATLEGFGTEGLTEELITEADAENRNAPLVGGGSDQGAQRGRGRGRADGRDRDRGRARERRT